MDERLERAVEAEKKFWSCPGIGAIWNLADGAEAYPVLVNFLRDLAKEESAREKGATILEILESPSFRDALALLVARRRMNYKSQGKWPERVAAAMMEKREGGRTVDLEDKLVNPVLREHLEQLHASLRWAGREVPRAMKGEAEILEYLSSGRFRTVPPARVAAARLQGTAAPRRDEKTFVEQLAARLSVYRQHLQGSGGYKQHAEDWLKSHWRDWYARRGRNPSQGQEIERLRKQIAGKKRK